MKNLEVRADNIQVTEAIENYLHKKVDRALEDYQSHVKEVRVNMTYEPKSNSHDVELIVLLRSMPKDAVRNKATSIDMYASIDIATANVWRQMRKLTKKTLDESRRRKSQGKLLTHADRQMFEQLAG